MPSLASMGTGGRHTYEQNAHTHKMKTDKLKKN